MEDIEQHKSQIEAQLKETRTAVRNVSPFMYDIFARAGKGALIGGFLGAFFFKSHFMRRSCALYGLGVGLGMNYSTVRSLTDSLLDTEKTHESEFYSEIDSL